MSGPTLGFAPPPIPTPGDRYDAENEAQFRTLVRDVASRMSQFAARSGATFVGVPVFPDPPPYYKADDESQFRRAVQGILNSFRTVASGVTYSGRAPLFSPFGIPSVPTSYDRDNESHFRRTVLLALGQAGNVPRLFMGDQATFVVETGRRRYGDAGDFGWDEAHDATDGDSVLVVDLASLLVQSNHLTEEGPFFQIMRSYVAVENPNEFSVASLIFPQAELGRSAGASAGSLRLYLWEDPPAYTEADYGSLGDATTLASDDEYPLDEIGGPLDTVEVEFTLNSAGLAHLNAGGRVYFALRFDFDAEDSNPGSTEDEVLFWIFNDLSEALTEDGDGGDGFFELDSAVLVEGSLVGGGVVLLDDMAEHVLTAIVTANTDSTIEFEGDATGAVSVRYRDPTSEVWPYIEGTQV